MIRPRFGPSAAVCQAPIKYKMTPDKKLKKNIFAGHLEGKLVALNEDRVILVIYAAFQLRTKYIKTENC